MNFICRCVYISSSTNHSNFCNINRTIVANFTEKRALEKFCPSCVQTKLNCFVFIGQMGCKKQGNVSNFEYPNQVKTCLQYKKYLIIILWSAMQFWFYSMEFHSCYEVSQGSNQVKLNHNLHKLLCPNVTFVC